MIRLKYSLIGCGMFWLAANVAGLTSMAEAGVRDYLRSAESAAETPAGRAALRSTEHRFQQCR